MKLESSRQAVSIATLCRSNSSRPLGPPAVCPDQHRVGREERGEHDDVAEQEDPEAVADDDALGDRSGRQRLRVGTFRRRGLGDSGRSSPAVASKRAHGVGCSWARCLAARAAVGPVDARDLVGRNDVLVLSRQANTTKVAKAPTNATATIHQMCQISAKPMMVAKKAQTKPVGVFRGISMSV